MFLNSWIFFERTKFHPTMNFFTKLDEIRNISESFFKMTSTGKLKSLGHHPGFFWRFTASTGKSGPSAPQFAGPFLTFWSCLTWATALSASLKCLLTGTTQFLGSGDPMGSRPFSTWDSAPPLRCSTNCSTRTISTANSLLVFAWCRQQGPGSMTLEF